MNRRAFRGVLGLLAAPLAAEAQQAGKVYRIGFLRAPQPPEQWIEAFQQGLRARGYIDSQNAVIGAQRPPTKVDSRAVTPQNASTRP